MLKELILKHKLAAGLLLIVALAYGVPAVYAHCGKCLTDAKHFATALEGSKMTLAAAATLAEVETGGTAVHATVLRAGEGANVEVHCLVDGAIMAVEIDGKTGKVNAKSVVKDLEGHAST